MGGRVHPSEVTEPAEYRELLRKFHLSAEFRRESLTRAAWRGYYKDDFLGMVKHQSAVLWPAGTDVSRVEQFHVM